jgi:hypothetical protein
MADHMLHFARVLGGGVDGHVIILAGNGERDMAFQIHMILAADLVAPLQAVGGRLQGARRRIAALQGQRLGHSG